MVDPAVFEAVNQRRVEMGREPVYDTRKIWVCVRDGRGPDRDDEVWDQRYWAAVLGGYAVSGAVCVSRRSGAGYVAIALAVRLSVFL